MRAVFRDWLDGPVRTSFWIGAGAVPGAIAATLVLYWAGVLP